MGNMRSSTETIIGALRILANEIQSGDGVANACIQEAADRLEELCSERDMYQRQADYLVERLGETQMRMIDAERICNKIYIARNISLSEECVVSALAEIDKTYRTQNDGN